MCSGAVFLIALFLCALCQNNSPGFGELAVRPERPGCFRKRPLVQRRDSNVFQRQRKRYRQAFSYECQFVYVSADREAPALRGCREFQGSALRSILQEKKPAQHFYAVRVQYSIVNQPSIPQGSLP